MHIFETFDRAHNCLRFLIKEYNIREMYLPYYLCDVIRHTLFEEDCKPIFYHIDDNFMPAIEFPQESYVLYPNYFGILGENVKKLGSTYPKLIVDNAHAFFDLPSGFACFNSGAKFGFGDIAYLWVRKFPFHNMPEAQNITSSHLNIKQKCRNRFMELHKTYSGINCLNIRLNEDMAPFCYPLLIESAEKADKIVEELISQGLTIYRYWNPLPKSYNEYKFYSRLVPIPVAEILSSP